MASPAYRSHTNTSYAGSGTTRDAVKPTGLADNDFVILVLYLEPTTIETVTWPSGFTQLLSVINTSTAGKEMQISIARKFITSAAGEPANYTATWTNSLGNRILAAAYSGTYSTTPIDDFGSQNSATAGTVVTCPAVTADAADTLVVAIPCNWDGTNDWTSNDGTTTRQNTGTIGLADEVVASAGAVAANTLSADISSAWIGVSILLASQASAAVTREQEGYRWRADDGSETTATWLASQDTDISRAKLTNTRLRILTNVTSDPPSEAVKLQYRKVGAAGWRDVTT